MKPLPSQQRPLLAICIPTFNRASSLRNLFYSLDAVKTRFGDEIEICISNNGSTDNTHEVIAEFVEKHPINLYTQASNVGATLNIIMVASQMNASWGIWCGDDDEFDVDGIGRLLERLRTLQVSTWVLVDSAGASGQSLYMQHVAEGDFDAAGFRRAMLRSGLDPYGFMGVHVFPRSAVTLLQSLQLLEAQPWPNIVGLLRFVMLENTRVHTMREIVTHQAKGGNNLFWLAGDLARIHLSKLRILHHITISAHTNNSFLKILMLSELYAKSKIGLMLAWRIYEPEDFNAHAWNTYCDAWSRLGLWLPAALPHVFAFTLVRLTPHPIMTVLLQITGRRHYIQRYIRRKQELQSFDGIKRGL